MKKKTKLTFKEKMDRTAAILAKTPPEAGHVIESSRAFFVRSKGGKVDLKKDVRRL